MSHKKAKATGIGGIFFKCQNPDEMRNWYGHHLGLKTDDYGAVFKFKKFDAPEETGYLQWSTFSQESKHMQPSKKDFMINYRVDNLELLVAQLKKEGISVLEEIKTYDYGKFAHIMDPEGNKIELWEPVDKVFDEYYKE